MDYSSSSRQNLYRFAPEYYGTWARLGSFAPSCWIHRKWVSSLEDNAATRRRPIIMGPNISGLDYTKTGPHKPLEESRKRRGGADNNVYGELLWHSVFLFSCGFTSLARGGEGITCTEVTHFLSHVTTADSRRQMKFLRKHSQLVRWNVRIKTVLVASFQVIPPLNRWLYLYHAMGSLQPCSCQ